MPIQYEAMIREATVEDVPSLAELCAELGYQVSAEDLLERLQQVICDEDHAVFVGEVEGKVCGWIHVSIHKTLVIERQAHILGLVVKEELRRHGIGRKLLTRAEEWGIMAHQCRKIGLKSNVVRQDAHLFYENLGYQNVKTQYVFNKSL